MVEVKSNGMVSTRNINRRQLLKSSGKEIFPQQFAFFYLFMCLDLAVVVVVVVVEWHTIQNLFFLCVICTSFSNTD